MNKKIIISAIILLFLVSNIYASPIPSTSPCRIIGSVDINGDAALNGLTIKAVPSESAQKSTTTSDGNYNLNAIGATDGETITLYLCGISAVSAFDFTPFCKTSETEPWIVKNIDLDLQTDGTSGCTCDAVCEGGTCVNPGTAGVCSSEEYYCDEDGSCESTYGETTSTCASDCGSTGGGGFSTPSPTTETSITTSIPDGGSSTFSFSKSSELAIISIEVTVNNATTNTAFTVTETSNPSSAPIAIASADGSVYKYLQITSTILNPNIKESTVKFKVSKSWITSNSIDPEKMYLQKLVNNIWVKMDTIKTGEDALYFYYEASVPSFSVYSIIGLKKEIPAPVIIKTHSECSNEKCIVAQGEGTNACTSDEQCKKAPVVPPVQPTHKECKDEKCISVEGEGTDQCTDDNSCIIAPLPKPIQSASPMGFIVLVIIVLLIIFFSGSIAIWNHKRKVKSMRKRWLNIRRK